MIYLDSAALVKLVRLEQRIADPSRFRICLFNHYPTYAMLMFDDELYMYPYGYRVLGNFCPLFYANGDAEISDFFRSQFDSMMNDALPAVRLYQEGETRP